VLSPVPGLDVGTEASGDGDIVVGAVCGREREPGCGECESCILFEDGNIGGRIEERGEIIGGGVEDSPLGISTILPNPKPDTKDDPDIVLLTAGGNPLVDILKWRPSRPLGTSRISLLAWFKLLPLA
jgi:hypothetical protein